MASNRTPIAVVDVLHDVKSAASEFPGTIGLAAVTFVSTTTWPFLWRALHARGHTAGFHYGDFGAYWLTVVAWLSGNPLYDVEDPFGGWLYPPVYLLGIYPFERIFDFATGAVVWTAVSVGLLWLAIHLLVSTYWPRVRFIGLPVTFAVVVGFIPVWYGMRLGQASMIVAAIMTAAFLAMERRGPGDRRRALVSGALTTIAATVKVFYATAGAHLLVDRKRFVAALTTGLGLAIVSLAVFGIDAHRDYLAVLMWGAGWDAHSLHPSWAWFDGYFDPFYYFPGVYSLPFRVIGIGAILGLAYWTRDRGADRELFILGIAAIPLIGPTASVHDFAVVLPAIVGLLAIEFTREEYPWIPVLAFLLLHWHSYGLLVLARMPEWVPLSGSIVHWSPLLQPGLWGLVLLFGLAAYRVYEYRPIQM